MQRYCFCNVNTNAANRTQPIPQRIEVNEENKALFYTRRTLTYGVEQLRQ